MAADPGRSKNPTTNDMSGSEALPSTGVHRDWSSMPASSQERSGLAGCPRGDVDPMVPAPVDGDAAPGRPSLASLRAQAMCSSSQLSQLAINQGSRSDETLHNVRQHFGRRSTT
eukprot:scaffold79182_cov51-Prasinocladus_malaysianus.AAC.7